MTFPFAFFYCKRNACEHAEGIPQFMASPQCLGYSRYRTVTRDLCFPAREDVLNRTEQAVRKLGAKALFVATDNDPMLEELKLRLKGMNVSCVCLGPDANRGIFVNFSSFALSHEARHLLETYSIQKKLMLRIMSVSV